MARCNEVVELALGVLTDGGDNRPEIDVVFTDPVGDARRVPAFLSRGSWWVRYASSLPGEHRFEVEGAGSGVVASGNVTVTADARSDGLGRHGPVRVAKDGRHFEHLDSTPFLWLADTWWDAFTTRISDRQFTDLAAQRAEQGFSVIQVVAGLYPEMEPFAPEGASRTGWVWERDFTMLNSGWFDEADRRVTELVRHGLVPCVVGAWGHYIETMGVQRMRRHWRELIARWGAYPVVWCLAGELSAPSYEQMHDAASQLESGHLRAGDAVRLLGRTVTSHGRRLAGRRRAGFPDTGLIVQQLGLRHVADSQVAAWAQVARYVDQIEPFGRPVTAHPAANWPIDTLAMPSDLIDFWMLQTGHSALDTPATSVTQLTDTLQRRPREPVLVGEVCYEGILGSSWHPTQRFLFYSHMLSGAAGHSYGAQGLWGFNTPDYLGGIAGRWNDLTWQQAADLPGATHLGIGRRLLERLPWTHFAPHPAWVSPHATARDRIQPYAAGSPDGTRLIYFPAPGLMRRSLGFHRFTLDHLDNPDWRARYINPRTGDHEPVFAIHPDQDGTATLSHGLQGPLPSKEDWLLLLEPSQ